MTTMQELITAAKAYDDDAGNGASILMNDPSLDSAGDSLVERLVMVISSFYPDAAEADVRAAVVSHWVF